MKNPHLTPRQGFTLIEMLVVIAIIALLVLLMLPGINKSMEAARTVKCAGGMQQVAGAIIQFAADHDGVLPKFQRRAGDAGYDTNWGAELILGGYVDAPLADTEEDIPAISPFRCASGLTDAPWGNGLPNDIFTSDPQVHRPWAARVTVTDASGTNTKYVHIWYAINARTENDGHAYPFDRPKVETTDAPRRLSRLRYMDKTVMFL